MAVDVTRAGVVRIIETSSLSTTDRTWKIICNCVFTRGFATNFNLNRMMIFFTLDIAILKRYKAEGTATEEILDFLLTIYEETLTSGVCFGLSVQYAYILNGCFAGADCCFYSKSG